MRSFLSVLHGILGRTNFVKQESSHLASPGLQPSDYRPVPAEFLHYQARQRLHLALEGFADRHGIKGYTPAGHQK